MKLTINKGSENYTASVVKINDVSPIEGADRIVKTFINGNPIIISKEIKVGDVVVYITAGSQLSETLCRENNLYESSELNKDNSKRGFIDKKRRVKSVKLRGEISNGLTLPLDSFPIGLNVGDEFTTIDGIDFVNKYIVPSNIQLEGGNKSKKKLKRISRIIENQFNFHIDTSHLIKNLHQISPNSEIEISFKTHGASNIVSNQLVRKNLSWIEKILKKFGVNVVDTEYDFIFASRKVIKNSELISENQNSYYKEDIWSLVGQEVKHLIPKGYTLYGEIVGYTPSGTMIQKNYDYGCKKGEHKFIIYRITYTNIDGVVRELSANHIKEFCDERGLLFSEYLIFSGRANEFYSFEEGMSPRDWQEGFYQKLVDNYTEKDCPFSVNKVPEEGVVVRVDSGKGYKAFKLKSQRFILGEMKEQDKGEFNIEDNG